MSSLLDSPKYPCSQTCDPAGEAAAELAAALVRSLFCGMRPDENRVAVFLAYSDETETGDRDGLFLTGGCVAPEDSWQHFARAWQSRVLNGPPKIPYLHMTEIRDGDWQKEQGLSIRDADDRVSEAVRVIRSTGGVSLISSEMSKRDLREGIQDMLKRKGEDIVRGVDQPDYLCFLAFCEFAVAHVYKTSPEVEKVNFVVSRKQKVTYHIGQFHEDLKKQIDPPLRALVGDLFPGDMTRMLPLQAADLVCWHCQRFLSGKADSADRMRLDKLGKNGYRHEYSRSDLEDMGVDLLRRIITKRT
jgi:hypothetical protein